MMYYLTINNMYPSHFLASLGMKAQSSRYVREQGVEKEYIVLHKAT